MLHLIWYIIVGLIAGLAEIDHAHAHVAVVERSCSASSDSIIGGLVTHLFSAPKAARNFIPQYYRLHTWGPAGVVSLAQVQGFIFPPIRMEIGIRNQRSEIGDQKSEWGGVGAA